MQNHKVGQKFKQLMALKNSLMEMALLESGEHIPIKFK